MTSHRAMARLTQQGTHDTGRDEGGEMTTELHLMRGTSIWMGEQVDDDGCNGELGGGWENLMI
jgi:hypothetical protein